MLAPVAHGRRLQRLRAHQVRGEAEPADVGRQVSQPERRLEVPQVFEEPRPVRPARELVVLFGREARRDELIDVSRLIEGRDQAVAGRP